MRDADATDPWGVADGVVVLRSPRPVDVAVLAEARDPEWARWSGPDGGDRMPTAWVTRDADIVGWVDHRAERAGLRPLAPGEVTVGCGVFAPYRRCGHATRAVALLVHRLAVQGCHGTASVLVRRSDPAALGVAIRAGFGDRRAEGDSDHLSRPIPALAYGDGVVTIRRQDPADVDADLAAKDEEQIRWLWLPGERERWTAMTPAQQRVVVERWLRSNRESFGTGPRWMFAIDAADSRCVGSIGCDLASPVAPAGDANIAYACHPDHRGRGHTARAVRLALRFLVDHTAAPRAHLVVDRDNGPSLRVARSVVTAAPTEFVDARGRPMLRFIVEIGAQRRAASGA